MNSIAEHDAHAAPRIDRAALLHALHAIFLAESVLWEEEDLRPYECDGLSAYRRLPMVVVLPDTIEQVQAVMRLCHQRKVPVVARGRASRAVPCRIRRACC